MVYVDSFNVKYGRMIMCHLLADSQTELLEFVEKIKVNKKWIQEEGTPREHFDICLSKKKLALEFGAKEITRKELGDLILNREWKK